MWPNRKHEMSPLEQAIDDAIRYLDPNSEDYQQQVNIVEKLIKLKELDAPRRVSPDTKAMIAANIVGIILILRYEQGAVVTSKALSIVKKLL